MGGVAGTAPVPQAVCVFVRPADAAEMLIRGGRVRLFAPNLEGVPVSAGDRLLAHVNGDERRELRVVDTLPTGRVVIEAATIIVVALRCSSTA